MNVVVIKYTQRKTEKEKTQKKIKTTHRDNIKIKMKKVARDRKKNHNQEQPCVKYIHSYTQSHKMRDAFNKRPML